MRVDVRILGCSFVTNSLETHVLLARVLQGLSWRIGNESEERAAKRWTELGETYWFMFSNSFNDSASLQVHCLILGAFVDQAISFGDWVSQQMSIDTSGCPWMSVGNVRYFVQTALVQVESF